MAFDPVVRATQRWLARFVIELGLCPFAQQVVPHITVSRAASEQQLLNALAQELNALVACEQRETTLLVHPDVLQDFLDYNDFLACCDKLLATQDLEGVFQIASFHPDYQFAGTEPDDPENFANRSPYPMLHLLREASVSRAVDGHPDVERIVTRNAEVLGQLGSDALRARRAECLSDD